MHDAAQSSLWSPAWTGVLCFLLLAALALRLYGLDAQDIWWDEARNIEVAARPLLQIAGSSELDIHPPVYFYLLHFWMALTGRTPFAIRFLSLWFGVLLVVLSYALARRAGGRWAGLGAAIAAAALPFLVGEAQEARMYTVMCAWLAAAALCLLAVVRQSTAVAGQPGRSGDIPDGESPVRAKRGIPPGERRVAGLVGWAAFALFSALALLTHYAAAFALVVLWGWAAAWAVLAPGRTRPRRIRALAAAVLGAAALCLPALPIALRQVSGYRNPNLVVPSVGNYLQQLWRTYGPGEHLEQALARPWELLLAALVLGGLLLAVAKFRKSGQHLAVWLLALAWALVPLVLYYVVIKDRSTFATRYISAALPGWLILAGLALSGWRQAGRAGGALAGIALVIALAPGLHGDLTDTRFFREDTSGVAAWLKANAGPDDLVLADQVYPLGFYYERWGGPAEPPANPPQMAPARYFFTDINTAAEQLTALARGKQRIFWVRWFESDTDPRDATPFLLRKFGTSLGEKTFRGYTVTPYSIAPDTQFELAPPLAPLAVDFAGEVRLAAAAFGGRGAGRHATTAETRAASATADGVVWAAVRWERLPAAARTLKASLVLEDADGVVFGQDDRIIVNDRHLTPAHWSTTDRPLGVFMIRPAPGAAPGPYTLKLAVYDPATMIRLPAAGTGSGTGANAEFTVIGQVQLSSAATPPDYSGLPLAASPEFSWREMRLLGAGPLPVEAGPGTDVAIDLYWQAQRAPGSGYRLEMALLDSAGAAHSVSVADPVAGRYPTASWLPGEVVRDRHSWRIEPGTPNGDYEIGLRWLDPASGESSPPVTLGRVRIAGRAHSFEPPAALTTPGPRTSGASIGDFARLAAFELSPGSPAAGDELAVTLYWQADGTASRPYTVFIQLLDGSGKLRAQRDQQPGAGALPTSGWLRGEYMADRYRVPLPPDLPPGPYTLQIGMYDGATGARLPVTGGDGGALGDALVLTGIVIR